MKNQKPYKLNINISSSADLTSCEIKSAASVPDEFTLAAMLAGAVVAIAHDHSNDPHAFAKTVTCTVMEFIDKPGFTKPKEQLS